MDNIERLIGQFEEFKDNAIDHRKMMEAKIDKIALIIDEIKVQTYKTNGRVNVIEPIVEELKKEFKEHKEKGIKTETYLALLWATIAALGTGIIVAFFEQVTKTK